jgi:hypothetical protein
MAAIKLSENVKFFRWLVIQDSVKYRALVFFDWVNKKEHRVACVVCRHEAK